MTLTRGERIMWTLFIRMTKSEKLLNLKENHLQIAAAFQKEYDRRKKIFKEIEE